MFSKGSLVVDKSRAVLAYIQDSNMKRAGSCLLYPSAELGQSNYFDANLQITSEYRRGMILDLSRHRSKLALEPRG